MIADLSRHGSCCRGYAEHRLAQTDAISRCVVRGMNGAVEGNVIPGLLGSAPSGRRESQVRASADIAYAAGPPSVGGAVDPAQQNHVPDFRAANRMLCGLQGDSL